MYGFNRLCPVCGTCRVCGIILSTDVVFYEQENDIRAGCNRLSRCLEATPVVCDIGFDAGAVVAHCDQRMCVKWYLAKITFVELAIDVHCPAILVTELCWKAQLLEISIPDVEEIAECVDMLCWGLNMNDAGCVMSM